MIRWLSAILLLTFVAAIARSTSAQTRVDFDGAPGIVRVDDGHCTMPCSLFMASGQHSVLFKGDAFKIDVPSQPAFQTHFHTEMDTLDVAGGSVVGGIGLTALVIVMLLGTGAVGADDSGNASLFPAGVGIFGSIAGAVLITGAIWLAMGIMHSGPRLTTK